MPFKTLTKNLIIESYLINKDSLSSSKKSSSSSKKSSSSSNKSSVSTKKSSSSSKKSSSSSPNIGVPTQEEIDRYINNKLLNIKRNKNAIIMVGGPGSGKTSGIKIVLDMTKKILDSRKIVLIKQTMFYKIFLIMTEQNMARQIKLIINYMKKH